ncbi:helicase protein with RING/U-box domain-containing protein isoform X2 [Carex rostrata]
MAVKRSAKRSRKVVYSLSSDSDSGSDFMAESLSSFSDSDSCDSDQSEPGTVHRPGKEKQRVGKREKSVSDRKKRGEIQIEPTLERHFLPDLNQAWSPLQVQSGDRFSDSDSDFSSEVETDLYLYEPQNQTRPRKKRQPTKTKNSRAGKKSRGEAETRPKLHWENWSEQNEKWIDELEGDDPDRAIDNPKACDPSTAVLLPLLRFQKEWLSWALNQEDSEIKGGILADEMGMGKTIQAISLVLTARDMRAKSGAGTSISFDNKSTLVICPVVAVIQWAGEIAKHTQKGNVTVLVYHGAKRAKGEVDFGQYDFVLTTYATIESDYRKHIMPPKEKCQYCGKGFVSEAKLDTHRRYFCGPGHVKTEKQARQQTKKNRGLSKDMKSVELVSSDSESDSELNEKNGRKNMNKGTKKKKAKGDEFVEDLANSSTPRGKSPLHSVKWERIILDEAHCIKDRRSNTARAVFALKGEYKWALSGTPLQNRVGELYSLIRFLEVFPYSYYLCKDCNCRLQDFSFSKVCTDCGHSSVRHFCWWNKYIARPMQVSSSQKAGQRAMTLLRGKVLKNIVLRRTKKGRAADIALPSKLVVLRRDLMDEQEHEFYEALYTQSCTQFDSYVEAGTLMNNYAHIFDLLTRLRQAVDHPYLVLYSATSQALEGCHDYAASKTDCGLCGGFEAEDVVVTSCEHSFCKSCLIDYCSSLGIPSCPTCSTPLTVDLTTRNCGEKFQKASKVKGYRRSSILNRINLSNFKTSTKIEALSGIKCVQLVGSMTINEREKAIKTFTDDPDCKIFLMSLKAGGVALNLTVASHVFMMDPWWNPAVEKQAQDRIHRIGQFKPISCTRFVIESTVEERILKLQEKKELVFEGTVGDSAEAMAKLTEADLRFLFHT